MQSWSERRRYERFALKWSAGVRTEVRSDSIAAVTQNMSCGGLFCLADKALSPGENVEILIVLPEEMKLNRVSPHLRCLASVVRVEPRRPDGCSGIAFRIRDFLVDGARQIRALSGWNER